MYILAINWFRKMIIFPNKGTLCSCLKVDLSQVTKINISSDVICTLI